MKRCLITGASGFVGANLARRLLQDGHETHVFLRPEHRSWRLEEIASHLHAHAVDVTDREEVGQVVRRIRPEWVFHLAAYGAYSTQTGFARMVDTNLMGCVSLLDACVDTRPEAFVYTGSSSEYGYKDHPPREEDRLEPNSHYAITKAAATHYCQFVARQTGINAVTVRLYSIYGPYEDPARLIPTLLVHGFRGTLPALVSPTTARDFVYVEEAVDALVCVAQKCVRQSVRPGAVYNLCTGTQTNLASVVETVRKLMGITVEPVWSSMERRAWDTDIWVGSPAAMENEMGWRSKVDFATGLQRMIDWLRSYSGWLEHYSSLVE
jgi:dolichol-phosphate mannosyltransferase